jgi:hypothetical protein
MGADDLTIKIQFRDIYGRAYVIFGRYLPINDEPAGASNICQEGSYAEVP